MHRILNQGNFTDGLGRGGQQTTPQQCISAGACQGTVCFESVCRSVAKEVQEDLAGVGACVYKGMVGMKPKELGVLDFERTPTGHKRLGDSWRDKWRVYNRSNAHQPLNGRPD